MAAAQSTHGGIDIPNPFRFTFLNPVAPTAAAADGVSGPRRVVRRTRDDDEEEHVRAARATRSRTVPVTSPVQAAAARAPVPVAAPAAAPVPTTAPAAVRLPLPRSLPPLPPLPTFAPRVVEELKGSTLADASERVTAEATCSICMDLMLDPHALTCGHTFCGPCGLQWLRTRGICPTCRGRASKPVPVRVLSDIIEWLAVGTLDAEQKAARDTRKLEWQAVQLSDAQELRASSMARMARGHAAPAIRVDGTVTPQDLSSRIQAAVTNPFPMLNALTNVTPVATTSGWPVVWRVDYESSGRSLCHTCYLRISEGDVRVLRETVTPGGNPIRDFNHLACMTLRCQPEQLRGLDELRRADRRRVTAAMARASA